jgi:hypothetical protein
MPPRIERQAAAAPPAARQAGVASEKPEKSELADAQLRPTNAAHPAPAEIAAAKPSGRWDRPAEARAATPEPSRFAPPPRGAALFRPKAPVPEPAPPEDEPPDLAAFGEGANEEDGYEPGTLVPEDLDALPIYGEDELPPFPDELEELERRRPRRGLFLGAGALAVVLAAGVAYVMLRSESSVATPPIIAADASPAKIVPAATPASNDEQNKLIYDRVNGGQSADGTKLVTPGDDKVAAAPAASADENNPISRVIAPGGPGFDQPAKAGDAAASGDPPADAPAATEGDNGQISPKKVRTVVVRPDMTVVSSKAASADDAGKLPAGASPAVPPAAGPTADANPDVPPKTTQMDAVVDNGKGLPIAVNADPLGANGGGDKTGAVATPGGGASGARAAAAGSVPASDDAASAAPVANDGAAAEPAAVAKPPTPPAKPADKPVVLASRGPIDLTPSKGAKPSPAVPAAAPAGSAFVQVSAQKSEDAAKSAYRDLQAKFPTIFGKLDPNIQRADLGDKGVYFRVRVGPFASADAQKVCGNYKAAGGDCIIAH